MLIIFIAGRGEQTAITQHIEEELRWYLQDLSQHKSVDFRILQEAFFSLLHKASKIS